ncbi:granulocyte colony-stimulating factor receptor-like isoform X2 [Pelodiscus sinensis]|uniref:granulocyte colony-stimulating factor receptor-like isoform X2 n=1 Tax=Pelodiscus sinensis TaxID=13735 RepID=UPI003F6D9EFB
MWLNVMLPWMFSFGISRSGANSPGSRIPTPQPSCGMLSLHPPVASLGAPLMASCSLDPSCQQMGHARPSDIVWRLNGESRQLPLSQGAARNGTVAAVAVLRAEWPRGELSCYLPHRSHLHLLGTAEYQAGVPPGGLRVERCVSFWGGNITCYWDPGPETYLPTTYTLHITEEAGQCLWEVREAGTCVSSRESRSCTIPVENLFASFRVRLTAVNPLGQASAAGQCVHGMSIVKLSPPELSATANRSDCFHVAWRPPSEELLQVTDAQYELRYRDVEGAPWRQVEVPGAEAEPASKAVCGVSPFTNYSVQARARYRNVAFRWSQGSPSWSAWSPERFVRTLPTAPSRGPALWRRLARPAAADRNEITLLWKPLKPQDANGRILTYRLRWQQRGQPAALERLTRSLHYTLELPASEEHTFLLTATNAAGESPATKLRLPAGPAQAVPLPLPVLVSPESDRSLLLQWDPPGFAAPAYVFEWGWAWETRGPNSSWHYEPGNISRVVLAEAIEPGYLYSLTVFALSDGAVRAVGSASAYSKQIAPFRAPTLHPSRIWPTQVEVHWEEIPLEERGGFIRNYTISYQEQGKGAQALVVNGSVRRCLIAGLAPDSVLRVGISASNDGGSAQGSVLTIRTRSLDDDTVELLLSSLCMGLVALLLAAALACVLKHPLIRGSLWPQVPDPAKSHLASWLPQQMWPGPRTVPAEQGGRQRARVSDSPSHALVCGRQDKGVTTCKSFPEAAWAAEASSAGDKYRQPLQTIFAPGDVATPGRCPTGSRSKVEYSAVIVWVYPGGTPPSSGAAWPLCTPQSPESTGPSQEPGRGVCFQNPSYEALDGPCWRSGQQPDAGVASLGAFPLLRTVVAEGSGDPHPNGDHPGCTSSPVAP